MTSYAHRFAITAAVMLLGIAVTFATFSPALSQQTTILTVTGNLDNPSRGGFDKDTDVFFEYAGAEFSKAREFDATSLEGLDMVSVRADFPAGGDVHTYEGPLLAEVLKAAGAAGQKVTIQALDGYAMEAPLAELLDAGAVVALKRNGEPFSIGGFGPTQIVFPRAERDDLRNMNDDRWVWSVFHIKVE